MQGVSLDGIWIFAAFTLFDLCIDTLSSPRNICLDTVIIFLVNSFYKIQELLSRFLFCRNVSKSGCWCNRIHGTHSGLPFSSGPWMPWTVWMTKSTAIGRGYYRSLLILVGYNTVIWKIVMP